MFSLYFYFRLLIYLCKKIYFLLLSEDCSIVEIFFIFIARMINYLDVLSLLKQCRSSLHHQLYLYSFSAARLPFLFLFSYSSQTNILIHSKNHLSSYWLSSFLDLDEPCTQKKFFSLKADRKIFRMCLCYCKYIFIKNCQSK